MGKNDNTYEKRRREAEKKRKADEKLKRKRIKKDGVIANADAPSFGARSESISVDVEDTPSE